MSGASAVVRFLYMISEAVKFGQNGIDRGGHGLANDIAETIGLKLPAGNAHQQQLSWTPACHFGDKQRLRQQRDCGSRRSGAPKRVRSSRR